MARKLNKNLVGGLTLGGMALLAVLGVLLIWNLPKQDPTVYVEEARKLEEAGEHNRAMQTYMRAYGKDPQRNPEYLVMAARAALADGTTAAIRTARQCVGQALVADPSLESALELSTDMEFEFAREFGGRVLWERVLERADKWLSVQEKPVAPGGGSEQDVPQKAAAYAKALYARGMAYLNLRGADQGAEDKSYQERGEEDLQQAFELDPLNVDLLRDLVDQFWSQVNRKLGEGRKAEADTLKQTIDSLVAKTIEQCQALADAEKVAALRRMQALNLIRHQRIEEGTALLEQLAGAEQATAEARLLLAQLYAGMITRDLEPDLAKSAAALEQGLQADPKDPRLYQLLGEIYKRQERANDALSLFQRGLEEIPYRDNLRATRDNRYRIQFFSELFLQEMGRVEGARRKSDTTEEAAALAAAEQLLGRMKQEVDEQTLPVRFLSACLYKLRGDQINAIQEAEEANKQVGAERHLLLQGLLAELYLQQGKWGAARKALESALVLNPQAPALYMNLAQAYLQMDEPQKALICVKPTTPGPLREFMDRNETAIQLRIAAHEKLGQYELAKAEAAKLGAATPLGELRQAQLLLSEGREADAEKKIREVLQKDPDNADAIALLLRTYLLTERSQEARELIAERLKKEPDNRTLQRYQLELAKEDDPAARAAMIVEFLKGEKDEFARALGLARYYLARNEAAEAAKHLAEAERLRPDDPATIENQFLAAVRAQDWPQAEKYVVRGAELNIDGTDGKVMAGRLSLARGEFEQAIEQIKAGLAKYPSFSTGWTYLAEAQLKANRVEEAKEALRRALEIDPTNGIANRGMLQIAVAEKNPADEKKYLELARKFLPNDPWVVERAQIQKEKENPSEGIAGREKIRREDPSNLPNLLLLARLYVLPQVKEYDKAAEVYQQALEVSKNDLDVAFEIATFYGREDVRRPQEGEAVLTKLLKAEEESGRKALIQICLGQFFEGQKQLATADRHFRIAVSLDPSARVLISSGEFYARNNREKDAIEYYERALKKLEVEDRDQAKATRSRIIGLLLAMGDLEAAKGKIDDYVKAYPDDAQGMVFEGAYHRMGGDIAKSKESFDSYLAKHPDSALVLWQRGQLFMLMGRYGAAIDDLKKAKVYKPAGFGYQHRIALADGLIKIGRGDEAIAELTQILQENPDEQAVAEGLVEAYLTVRPPRFVDAENVVVSYMRRFPEDARWPMLLGRLGVESQNWPKAIQGFESAAELTRYRATAVSSLFSAYRSANRPRDLIRFAEEKLSSQVLDTQPDALAALAWAYSRVNEEKKSFDTYDRALTIAQDFPMRTRIVSEMSGVFGKDAILSRAKARVEADPNNVSNMQVLVLLLFMNDQLEEAIKLCDRIRELAVDDTDAIFAALAQAMLYDNLGRYPEAKAKYEEVLKINPRQSTALNNLAYLVLERMNDPAEALPYAREAYRVQPGDPNTLDTYGWALARNNRLGEAAGRLLRALEIERDCVPATYHLGLVHKMRGELDDARQRLNEAKAAAEAQGDQRTLPKIIEALRELE